MSLDSHESMTVGASSVVSSQYTGVPFLHVKTLERYNDLNDDVIDVSIDSANIDSQEGPVALRNKASTNQLSTNTCSEQCQIATSNIHWLSIE